MIRFDIFELAATASVRDNLTTIVDAGITNFTIKDTSQPVRVVSVIRISFTEEHVDRDYLCVLEVRGPDEQIRTSKDFKINSLRPPGTIKELPISAVIINAISFIPAQFGIFTVKFYLAGEDTREISLLVRPAN